MGFTSKENQQDAADYFMKLYNVFCSTDATLVEINPMAEDNNGKGMSDSMTVLSQYYRLCHKCCTSLVKYSAWTAK